MEVLKGKKEMDIFDKGVKYAHSYWENKIGKKIEELKEQRRMLGFKTYLRREDILNDDRAIACEISVLQELLEKE